MSEAGITIVPPQQAEIQRTFRKISRREISGRLLPQQGILSPQRLERNEPCSNHRLTYKAISVSESVIKIGGLLFLFAFGI
jgi:hypothetical protein